MSMLVPYEAAEAGLPMSTLVPMLYKDAKWAGRKIGRGLSRAYRRRKASRKKRKLTTYPEVGEPMKDIHMKRELTHTDNDVPTNTRTLYFEELTGINGLAIGEDDRSRALINCKGIQLTYHFYNKDTQPMFLNVAIIAPKHNSSGVTDVDFFRGNDGTRGETFSTAKSALELHYLPINTDRYVVMKHNRHQLGARDDTAVYNSKAGPGSWISKKLWLPVNRQLRYESGSSTTCNTPIYVAWWCDRMRSTNSQLAETDLVRTSMMHTMFFTDVL